MKISLKKFGNISKKMQLVKVKFHFLKTQNIHISINLKLHFETRLIMDI
jgi:hypothetical protein